MLRRIRPDASRPPSRRGHARNVKAQVRTSFTARTVGKCDEAHLLEPAQLEELRLLTNAEMDSASPFAGILAGQPTLNRQLRMGMFAALVISSLN